MVKRKLSPSKTLNYGFMIFFIVIILALFVLGINSEDIDEVCSQNNMTLFRWDGEWQCGSLSNFIINNVTNNITMLNESDPKAYNGTLRLTNNQTFYGNVSMGNETPLANLYLYQYSPSDNQILFRIGTNADNNRFAIDEDGDTTCDGTLTTTGDVQVSGGDLYNNINNFLVLAEDHLIFKMDSANNDNDNTNGIYFGRNGGAGSGVPTGSNLLMIINETGNVGINTSTPQNTFNVVGDANITGLIYGNGSQLHSVNYTELDSKAYNGTLRLTSNNTFNGAVTFSDAIVVNENGNDVNFRVESEDDANGMFFDGTTSGGLYLGGQQSTTSYFMATNSTIKFFTDTYDGEATSFQIWGRPVGNSVAQYMNILLSSINNTLNFGDTGSVDYVMSPLGWIVGGDVSSGRTWDSSLTVTSRGNGEDATILLVGDRWDHATANAWNITSDINTNDLYFINREDGIKSLNIKDTGGVDINGTLGLNSNFTISQVNSASTSILAINSTRGFTNILYLGQGGGYGQYRAYNQTATAYVAMYASGTKANLDAGGGADELQFQVGADNGVSFFDNAVSGETPQFTIDGYRATDAQREFKIAVGSTENNSVDFTGVSKYKFTGQLFVTGDINTTGCFSLSNGTIIGGSCVSDVSTKENIKNYSIDITTLDRLSPKEFEYKEDLYLGEKTIEIDKEDGTKEYTTESVYYPLPKGIQYGFIADDVEKEYPSWVTTDENGYKRIIYGQNWIFELWKQNQEQQEEITLLKNENAQIKSVLCKYYPEEEMCK